MRADDFNSAIKETLAKRVGARCSNPTCRKLTHGPREDPTNSVNIGVAAHITAASCGGPRFDLSITPAHRSSIENGIWLCQNCAKLIDNDARRYTVDLLKAWKQVAEEQARIEVEGDMAVPRPGETEEPFKFMDLQDPVLKKLIKDFKDQGEGPHFPAMSQKDSQLVQGHRVAYYPGTHREIWVGEQNGRYELILMLNPESKTQRSAGFASEGKI